MEYDSPATVLARLSCSCPTISTRLRKCLAVLVLLTVFSMVGCGSAGSGGGGEGGGAPEGVSHGGAGGDPTPVLTGTWEGTFEGEAFGRGRAAFNLEQGGGGELAGTGSVALADAAEPIESVDGLVRRPDDVTLSYQLSANGGDVLWTFEGGMEGGSISEMRGKLEVSLEENGEKVTETGTFELTRYPDLSSDPRALAVAAAQAVYDRNFFFLAENGHPDYEEYLQEESYPADLSAPTFAGAIQNQFDYETADVDEGPDASGAKPPPAGVTVRFDEASVREEGQEGGDYYITFDHQLSNGEEGYAEVALKTLGVDEAVSWRVDGIELEYRDNESLTLGDSY